MWPGTIIYTGGRRRRSPSRTASHTRLMSGFWENRRRLRRRPVGPPTRVRLRSRRGVISCTPPIPGSALRSSRNPTAGSFAHSRFPRLSRLWTRRSPGRRSKATSRNAVSFGRRPRGLKCIPSTRRSRVVRRRTSSNGFSTTGSRTGPRSCSFRSSRAKRSRGERRCPSAISRGPGCRDAAAPSRAAGRTPDELPGSSAASPGRPAGDLGPPRLGGGIVPGLSPVSRANGDGVSVLGRSELSDRGAHPLFGSPRPSAASLRSDPHVLSDPPAALPAPGSRVLLFRLPARAACCLRGRDGGGCLSLLPPRPRRLAGPLPPLPDHPHALPTAEMASLSVHRRDRGALPASRPCFAVLLRTGTLRARLSLRGARRGDAHHGPRVPARLRRGAHPTKAMAQPRLARADPGRAPGLWRVLRGAIREFLCVFCPARREARDVPSVRFPPRPVSKGGLPSGGISHSSRAGLRRGDFSVEEIPGSLLVLRLCLSPSDLRFHG